MRWQDSSVQFEGAVPFRGGSHFSINNATKSIGPQTTANATEPNNMPALREAAQQGQFLNWPAAIIFQSAATRSMIVARRDADLVRYSDGETDSHLLKARRKLAISV